MEAQKEQMEQIVENTTKAANSANRTSYLVRDAIGLIRDFVKTPRDFPTELMYADGNNITRLSIGTSRNPIHGIILAALLDKYLSADYQILNYVRKDARPEEYGSENKVFVVLAKEDSGQELSSSSFGVLSFLCGQRKN
jgi:hypothetical protein